MSRTLKIVLALNLIAVAILAFVYPSLMVGPGKLISGHLHLESDCFACHAPLRGAASERCASCHKPADIGRLTTKGLRVLKPLTTTPFHQKLIHQDCVACHSEHAGIKRFRKHDRFDHTLLQKEALDQCQSCHKFPDDTLHLHISENCSQCHNQKKWKPATFDHKKYFEFDHDHDVSCVTCHVGKDYRRYTCYGCHEHTLDNIRRKHSEGGIRIRNYDNCIRCHINADEFVRKDNDTRKGGRKEKGD